MNTSSLRLRAGIAPNSALIVGIELGGTKCICTLADDEGSIIDQKRLPTTTPVETLSGLATIADEWCERHHVSAMGIASFGPLDLAPQSARYGHILDTTKPLWAGADVLGTLAAKRDVPVAFDTDVNGAAAAEMRWGSGRGMSDFAYVTVGTGVGVGLIVNGLPTRGIGHCEMGHIRVPRLPGDEVPSVCNFHPDCVEGVASGPAIEAALGGIKVRNATSHDPVWERVVNAVAGLCHALVCTTGPQRIALGGGVIARQPHLIDRVELKLRESINGYLHVPADKPYVVAPDLGEQAGALGPVALASNLVAERRALRSA